MKKITAVILTCLIAGSVGVANAADYKNTASIGYAQTQLGGFYSGGMPGVNLKYHWEDLDSGFGAIASTSYTENNISNGWGGKIKQTTFLVGPSYRFSDYFNAYVMAGIANGKVDVPALNDHQSQNKFTYGVGFQVNPVDYLAIDASYQYARFNSGNEISPHIDAGTWVIGVGYSF
ncbi:outer membrane beta-barrel protein [Salmonella enterica]